jgi:hypothetical protein
MRGSTSDRQTPAGRVYSALDGEQRGSVPFTIYESKIPQCTVERDLRNRGMCIVQRVRSYEVEVPGASTKRVEYRDERGRRVVHTTITTPEGDLTSLVEPAGYTSWTHEHLFKRPEDYRPLRWYLEHAEVRPNYAPAKRLQATLGEDFVVRDNLPLEPLQALASTYMGVDRFCLEWMDNRDEVLSLYDALVATARRVYPIVANGPLDFANYGGNVAAAVIGPDVFRDYYVPHYQEAAEVLHREGMLLGTHLDADNTLIMADVGQTELDYIEAFDPSMGPSVAEAAAAWPGKVLWINWPSKHQLEPPENVTRRTMDIIQEGQACRGFIIGITEDIPEDRWQRHLQAIMAGIEEWEGRKVTR